MGAVRQNRETLPLSADILPDGKEKLWPTYDLEKTQVMVFDEFNIHPELESERQILD